MEILFKRNKQSSSEFPVRIAPGEPLWFKDELYIGSVGTAAGGTGTAGDLIKIGGLPDQTGNSGKFLTTDGTSASWVNKLHVPANQIKGIGFVSSNPKCIYVSQDVSFWSNGASDYSSYFILVCGATVTWNSNESSNRSFYKIDGTDSGNFTGYKWDNYTSISSGVYVARLSDGSLSLSRIGAYPNQTNHAGEFLTTNGTSVSWAPAPSSSGAELFPINITISSSSVISADKTYSQIIAAFDSGKIPVIKSINNNSSFFFIGKRADDTVIFQSENTRQGETFDILSIEYIWLTYGDEWHTSSVPKVTEDDVEGWGFTKNEGTLTGVTFNGTSATVSNGIASISASTLPTVASSDNGKIMQVVNGAWSLVTPVSVYTGNSAPNNSQGINGDIYIQL